MLKKQNVSERPPLNHGQIPLEKGKRKIKKRWIFRAIILTFLVIAGMGIYHNLNRPKAVQKNAEKTPIPFVVQQKDNAPVKNRQADKHPTTDADKPLIKDKAATSLTLQQKPIKTVVEVTEFKDTSLPVQPDKNTPIPVAQVIKTPLQPTTATDITEHKSDPIASDTTKTTVKNEESGSAPTEIQSADDTLPDTKPKTRSDYTLQDALIFRDHFLSEQSCANDFRKLILTDVKTFQMQEVITKTSYFCLSEPTVSDDLTAAFATAKKKALIRYYENQQPAWKGKIRAFLSSLIKVRNLNPTGSQVPDLLDKAHNALDGKNMTLCLETLNYLPETIKPIFARFSADAVRYTDAAGALDALILSYEKE
ncbi:MAG: hypothetical protein ACI4QM_04785 [Alphaproteobacteria bacterium]